MSAIALGIAGAGVAIEGYQAISQNAKANSLQKSLKNPIDEIPPEFFANREIARQMAQIGLPSQQYNNSVNNINSNQAAALATAQNSNNPAGAIQGILGQTNRAKANLDAEDAQARENNQRYFIQENSQLGHRKDQQEQANVFDPYTRDFNLMQSYRGASQQNLNTAANQAGQLGMSYLNYQNNNPTTPTVRPDQITDTSTPAANIPAQTAYDPFGGATPYQYPGMFQPYNGNPKYTNPYFNNQ